jgi:CheY-like chemotaxis protein
MDCRMPETEGCRAAGEIRKCEGAARHAPIVALTAGVRVEDRECRARAGMDAYVSKTVGSTAIGTVRLAARQSWR